MDQSELYLTRARIQRLRSLLLNGVDPESTEAEPFEQRIMDAVQPIQKYLFQLTDDPKERIKILKMLHQLIAISDDAFFEAGRRVGAKIMFELMSVSQHLEAFSATEKEERKQPSTPAESQANQ